MVGVQQGRPPLMSRQSLVFSCAPIAIFFLLLLHQSAVAFPLQRLPGSQQHHTTITHRFLLPRVLPIDGLQPKQQAVRSRFHSHSNVKKKSILSFFRHPSSSFLLSTSSSTSSSTTTTEDEEKEELVINKEDDSDNDSDSDSSDSIFGGWSDDEFQKWIYQALIDEASLPLIERYQSTIQRASQCITSWRKRYRGNPEVWKRLFKKQRVVKEVIEIIPILDATEEWIINQQTQTQNETQKSKSKKITILDLCSGKGYLSMMLSDYLLNPYKKQVQKIILVDKAWPRCHSIPSSHHMNWDHIYGSTTNQTITTTNTTTNNNDNNNDGNGNDGESYFTSWPIPLHTSKQDLKKSSTLRQMKKRLSTTTTNNNDEIILILAVHLCGTLSIQAVNLFHDIPNVKALILKPCCLPGIAHQRDKSTFDIGISTVGGVAGGAGQQQQRRPRYSFPTKEVCADGQWKRKEWIGPPRWHLEKRFNTWCYHLCQGMKALDLDNDDNNNDDNDKRKIESKLIEIPIQQKGGYQNTFILAEKVPLSPSLWTSFSSLSNKNE